MSQQATGLKQPAAPQQARPLKGPQSAEARRRERLGWILVTPSVLVVVIVALYPLVRTVILSLTNARLSSTRVTSFVGLSNYTDLLSDPKFLHALTNTLIF